MNKPFNFKIGAQDRASRVLNKIEDRFDDLNRKLEKTTGKLGRVNRKMRSLSMSMGNVGDAAKSIGTRLTTALTVPVALAGGASVNAFRKFEKGLIGVGKTTGIEGAELDKLGKKFRGLSKNVPVSVNNLLEFGEVIGQLGINKADDVAKFAEVFGKLQTASNIEGEEGVQSLGNTLRLIEGGVGKVENFASALVFLGNNTGANERQILGLAQEIGKSAQTFGLTSSQVLSLGSILKETGNEAEVSGSAIQRSLFAIQDAIFSGGRQFKMLQAITGKTADEIKKDFGEDAFSVLNSFSEGLVDLNKRGVSLKNVLKEFGVSGVRDIKVLTSLGNNTEKLNRILAQTKTSFNLATEGANALETEFKVASKSLDAKIIMTINKIKDLGISIGEKLAPFVLKGLKAIERFVGFLEKNPALVKFGMKLAVIAALLGPLAIGFGVAVGVLAKFLALASVLGGSVGALALVLGGLPLILAGIGLAVVALTGEWEAFKTLVDKGFELFGIENFSAKLKKEFTMLLKSLRVAVVETLSTLPFGESIAKSLGLDVVEAKLDKLRASKELDKARKKLPGVMANPEKRQQLREALLQGFDESTVNKLMRNAEQNKGRKRLLESKDGLLKNNAERFKQFIIDGTVRPEISKPKETQTFQQQTKQSASIEVDFKNMPQGTRVRANKRNLDSLNINLGMQGAFV